MKARHVFLFTSMALAFIVVAFRDGLALRPALVQQLPRPSHPHIIKAGTATEGELMRSLCVDGFPIGDTITAKLHPARVGLTRPNWWPRKFLVSLRLDTPVTARDSALLRLVVIGATIDGVVVRGAQGTFWIDVESMHIKAGEREVRCYSLLNGFVTKTLRFR